MNSTTFSPGRPGPERSRFFPFTLWAHLSERWPVQELLRAHLQGLGPLALRLWLAQEFLVAAWTKLQAGFVPPEWFAQLHFPPPVGWLPASLNWWSVMALEAVLGLALLLGLKTRWAAAGLMLVTLVAIASVHFDLGWQGWNQIETEAGQGFKLPLMMAMMLAALWGQGGGALACDAWWDRRKRNEGGMKGE
jgi:putative oxidoreductase